jgi:hypothetical protein
MEYRCKTQSMDRMIISPQGALYSLCENCQTKDCSNSIEKQKVSVFGVTRELKLFVRGSEYYCVVECAGYTF